MRYFAILGKNPALSIQELNMVNPQDLKIKDNLAMFDTDSPEKLKLLAGIPKYGHIVDMEEAEHLLLSQPLIGTKNQDFGVFLKKNFGVKRFKLVDEMAADMEIKEKGIEVFNINKEILGIVDGWQNIDLYEQIDFKKPESGMQIGMMPSKLAHIMLNIGLSQVSAENITVYDPFVGFGTTGFLANNLGYDFIGSDINATLIKQNLKRRKENPLSTDKKITIFKHDVNEKFEKKFLKNVNLIVTEGWLGPVVSHKTKYKELADNEEKIRALYQNFLDNVNEFYESVTMCFSVPMYNGNGYFVMDRVGDKLQKLGWTVENIDIYQRKGQFTARGIVLASK